MAQTEENSNDEYDEETDNLKQFNSIDSLPNHHPS